MPNISSESLRSRCLLIFSSERGPNDPEVLCPTDSRPLLVTHTSLPVPPGLSVFYIVVTRYPTEIQAHGPEGTVQRGRGGWRTAGEARPMALGTSNMADRKQSPQDGSRVGLQPSSAPRDPPLLGMPFALKVLQVPKTVPPGRGQSIQMQEPVGQV